MSRQGEALEKQILDDARKQSEPIRRRAQKKADEIIDKAREEAEQKKESIRENTREKAHIQAQRLLARAELEAANIRRQAQEEILLQVRSRAREKLRTLTDEDDYGEVLSGLCVSALRVMRGRRFELLMRPEDRDALGEDLARKVREEAARELGKQLTVNLAEETIDADGGLIVRREGGREVCDQTFAARLERLWEQLRRETAEKLGLLEMAEKKARERQHEATRSEEQSEGTETDQETHKEGEGEGERR